MATSYQVQKGDTLGAIAKKLGTSIGNLTGFRSGNADLIFPGETISVKPAGDSEAMTRASTVRSELADSPTPSSPQSTTPTGGSTLDNTGFDFTSLQTNLDDAKKKREDAFSKLDGFRTDRYQSLLDERDVDTKKEKVSELDSLITQKKNERDQALAKIRKNPGASASTLTGEGKVASDLLNNEINNLIGQRNSLANEYNSELAEIDSIVGREAKDLENSLGFFDTSVSEAETLLNTYQKALIDELRREEDRGYSIEDDLRDFEQALEIARMKDTGAGTNYTILTDQFGRPTVAIDKNNPTIQIDLSETDGSVPKNGTDPALLQSIANQQNQKKEGGGIINWFKGLFN